MPAVRDAARDAQGHLHGDGVRGHGGAVGEPRVGGTEEVLILDVDEPGGGTHEMVREKKSTQTHSAEREAEDWTIAEKWTQNETR